MLLSVTPSALEADWLFVDGISAPDYQLARGHRVLLES